MWEGKDLGTDSTQRQQSPISRCQQTTVVNDNNKSFVDTMATNLEGKHFKFKKLY